ncbi:type II secretion system secretin GspD [Acidovorax sp. SUPP3334]|uniref:type II secretion system secretin GspD n=1 Tax=Acidovorax sp. SUPP3334 TaxID=2920881 RepID=UPI0023DE24A6|nr:type II secretion system secretin GspD [Acidovorax sp. SUPP3334]GKT22028.1 type II secretion system secretin GspD [Acidovorax sp. SUPP3334]
MTPYRYALTAIALATCQLASAQTQQSVPASGGSNLVTESSGAVMPGPANSSSVNVSPKAVDKSKGDGEPVAEPRYIIGNDRVIAPAKPVATVQGAPLSFNFEEAPVAEVVRTILGDILKTDYVLHPPLSGTVTLATRTPIAPDQAVFLLESSLQANGLAMLRDARGTYHVGRPDALRSIGGSVRQVGNGPLPPGSGAIIVPLQYIGASEMASILRPMMPADAVVRVDNVRNLLILSGTRTQAEGWLDLVNTFDIDLLKGMSVGVFPLKHASIKEVETALRLVSGGGSATSGSPSGGAVAAGTPGAAQANAAGAAQAMLGEGNPLFGALRIMPIERLNSILVVTPRAAYLEEARRWIEKLDQPSDNGSEPQLFIYQVQNVNAKHLASVLSGIFGGQTGGSAVANSGVAPGLGNSTTNSFGQQSGFGSTGGNSFGGGSGYLGGSGSASAMRSSGFGGTGFGTGSTGALGNRGANNTQGTQQQGALSANLGSVRVMADELNNSVLIWGTRSEYSKIEAALKRLDLPPTQVLIEASIIEVTLNDELRYGLQWAFNNSRNGYTGQGLVSGTAPQTLSTDALLGGVGRGFSYVLSSANGVQVVLNALADKSLLKVISSPSLMVLDNHTASINVGSQEPITSDITTSNLNNNTTTSVQYKDTGVNLVVTPSVNSGNIVNMQVDQTVTDLGERRAQANLQPAFLQRQISSKVAVRSGETIVLGGLIKDNSTTGKGGVPLLQDIPVLGNLFGVNSKTNNRTELLVVLTPRVVRTDVDIREVSEDLRDRMKGLRIIELKEKDNAKPSASPQAPVQPVQPN